MEARPSEKMQTARPPFSVTVITQALQSTPGAGSPRVPGSGSWELPAPVKQGVKRQNREKHPLATFYTQIITAQAGYVARGMARRGLRPCSLPLGQLATPGGPPGQEANRDFLIQSLNYFRKGKVMTKLFAVFLIHFKILNKTNLRA